jgi:hypothetical protein
MSEVEVTISKGANVILPEILTLHTAAVANGNGSIVNASPSGSMIVDITGTFNAKITFEISWDKTTWIPVEGINIATRAKGESTQSTGTFLVPIHKMKYFRARILIG